MITSGGARACRVAVAALGAVAVALACGSRHAGAATVPAAAEPDVGGISPAALRDAALLAAPSIVSVDAEITGRLRDDASGTYRAYDLAFGGTGFFASSDGYVVTAAHVAAPTDEQVHTDFVDQRIDELNGCVRTTTDSCRAVEEAQEAAQLSRTRVDDVRVSVHVQTQDMSGEDTGLGAAVVARSASGLKDVAVLKVDVSDAPVLLLRSSLAPVDTPVAVEGYPESREDAPDPLVPTVTAGRVIDTRAGDEGFAASATVVETDARIEHGNSGGPGVDERGDVVGIVSYGPSTGVNFMISAGDVADVLRATPARNRLGHADELWRAGLGAQSRGDTPAARSDYTSCAALGTFEVGCRARLDELDGRTPQSASGASSVVPDLTGAEAAAWLGVGVGIGAVIGAAVTLLVVRVLPRRPASGTQVHASWEWSWGPSGWQLQPRSAPRQPSAWGAPAPWGAWPPQQYGSWPSPQPQQGWPPAPAAGAPPADPPVPPPGPS